ncbi:MAG: DUF255 domain-containing protein [Sulfurimonas sp.]|uniref:thioredoxin family protein n=1 Tax=Sulfurimonas sp. TaxID=2022749 RepID=UPI0025CECED4|nr:DUF255 domain-containing protein [Sulfurimonas sp.]MCK9455254.1 DUF255 domain-containing protein [Sulfurimonas sp.]
MKKIIFSFIFSSVALFGVDWLSYEDALGLQQKNSKIIMIDIVRTNCRYCIKMDRDVFDDKEMSTWVEERFIPVKLNLDIHEIPLGINVMITPSFYFVDKNQKIIKMIPGSWSSDDFKELTKKIKGE